MSARFNGANEFLSNTRLQLPSTSCKRGTFSYNNKAGDRLKLFPYPSSLDIK